MAPIGPATAVWAPWHTACIAVGMVQIQNTPEESSVSGAANRSGPLAFLPDHRTRGLSKAEAFALAEDRAQSGSGRRALLRLALYAIALAVCAIAAFGVLTLADAEGMADPARWFAARVSDDFAMGNGALVGSIFGVIAAVLLADCLRQR